MRPFLKLYWQKLLLLLLLFACATRLNNIFAALDYDEIWTMTYFSSKGIKAIFTELSLPNNQVLNSLCVKGILALEAPLWCIRLHSFIAGVLAVMLTIPIGIRLGGSRGAGFWSACFLLCSAPAAAYSQLARGYELQIFFLLLYTWGLLFAGVKKYHLWAAGAVAAGGVGAVLTLPTSVIYLGVITLCAFFARPRMPDKKLLMLLGAGVLFCGFWYGINLSQFRAGQQFGTVITSHKAFFTFAFNTLDALVPVLWCPFLLGGLLLLPRRRGAILACGIALVLLSAFVTRGGPVRVYIPLAVFAALLCGAGVDRLCRKAGKKWFVPALCALLCCAGGFYFNMKTWAPPDWYALFAKGRSQPQSTLVIYSGTNSFPVMWNNQPHSLADNSARIAAPLLEKLLCFTAKGELNGVDEKFNESTLPLKTRGIPADGGYLYSLEAISVPSDGDEVILISCKSDKAVDAALFKEIARTGRYLRLNIFFEDNSSEHTNCIRGGIVEKSSLFNWKELPDTVKLYRIVQ